MTGQNPTRTPNTGLLNKLFCKHTWVKRESWYQPDRSTGKVSCKCAHCGKIAKRPKSEF